MDIVKNWLNGKRNYTVGAAIYKTLGRNDKLKDLFARPATDHSRKKLAEEMSALLTPAAAEPADSGSVAPSSTSLPSVDLVPVNEETDKMPQSDNNVLNAIREEWLKPYQRMNYMRHQLDGIKGNHPDAIAARKPIVFEILELEQECMRIWAKRRHYEKTGELPEATKLEFDIPTDPIALGKFIEAAKKAIRHNRKQMKLHPDKPLYAQLYEHHKARYKAATGKDYEEKN